MSFAINVFLLDDILVYISHKKVFNFFLRSIHVQRKGCGENQWVIATLKAFWHFFRLEFSYSFVFFFCCFVFWPKVRLYFPSKTALLVVVVVVVPQILYSTQIHLFFSWLLSFFYFFWAKERQNWLRLKIFFPGHMNLWAD